MSLLLSKTKKFRPVELIYIIPHLNPHELVLRKNKSVRKETPQATVSPISEVVLFGLKKSKFDEYIKTQCESVKKHITNRLKKKCMYIAKLK